MAQQDNSIILKVVEDTFTLQNNAFPDDEQRNLVLGDVEFLKLWMSMGEDASKTNFGTFGFLKFNIPDLEPKKIINATLYMKPFFVFNSVDEPIGIFVSKIDDNYWYEDELTDNTKPKIKYDRPLPTVIISEPDEWYQWDVKKYTRMSTDDDLSLVVNFKTAPAPPFEYIVTFHSKEAENPANAPYLVIEYAEPISSQFTEGGGCLIATATYGTELAPQVQQLRELRDNILLQTESGTNFMNTFNDVYYSFSPYIADYERESPVFKEAVKIGITPLLSSLTIMSHADSESEVLGYGAGVILMNIGMYFVAPALIIMKVFSWSKYKRISFENPPCNTCVNND